MYIHILQMKLTLRKSMQERKSQSKNLIMLCVLIISPYYQHRTVIHVLPVLLNVQTHAFKSIDPHNYNTK